jgi:hypothetical protein
VIHTFNLSIRKTEAGELQVEGQPKLHSKFKANLPYIARPIATNKQKSKK